MRNFSYFRLTTLLFVLITVRSFGQFSLEAELRPRMEFRDGFKYLPDNSKTPEYVITQRSRLYLNYRNDIITTKVTLQDVRVWGDERLKMDVPATAIHEAWAQIKVCDSLGLRVGRQELVYDNERLLSKNNWTQQGTAHDAAVLKFQYKGWKLDFGSAFNQAFFVQGKENYFGTNYYNANDKDSLWSYNYKTLNYLWINKNIKRFTLSLLGIVDGYQGEATTNTTYLRATYGTMLYYKYNNLLIDGRGFLQSGTISNGKDINGNAGKVTINAFYANMDISYLFAKKFTVLAGFEYLSGQDNKNTNRYTAFNTLYGTNHKFNGNMEYFSGAPKSLKYAGLLNPYLNFIYSLSKKVSLRADVHYFTLNNNYYYTKKGKQRTGWKYLGTEGDLSCNIDFSKEVSLLMGYSCMVADPAMSNIIPGDRKRLGNWAFVQLTIKPVFFTSEKK